MTSVKAYFQKYQSVKYQQVMDAFDRCDSLYACNASDYAKKRAVKKLKRLYYGYHAVYGQKAPIDIDKLYC